MTDELALATRAAHELEPAAREFAAAMGRSPIGSALVDVLLDNIRYRWAPHKARLLMRAAEKIKQSGLPVHAVDDRILRAVLEDGGLDEDPEMQERWSSLLANAATGSPVPPAFPEILGQLEPVEARFLDGLFDADELCVLGDVFGHDALLPRHLDNLQRLGVMTHKGVFLPYGLPDRPVAETSVEITPLGTSLVIICRVPDPILS